MRLFQGSQLFAFSGSIRYGPDEIAVSSVAIEIEGKYEIC
jgi:hypothetical protein